MAIVFFDAGIVFFSLFLKYRLVLVTSSGQPGVGVRVNEELHVEHLPDVLVVEDEDPLQEDDVGGTDGGELARDASVLLEVVDWDLGRLALLDVLQAGDQQLVVERV